MRYTTRFNPTINGPVHLGHIYTALVNQAEAYRSNGRFIVRFDDTQKSWCDQLGAAKVAEFREGVKHDLAGFDVVGVDINPQPHYPFKFIQADALEYIAEHGGEYDAIHASPPCQHYSEIQKIVKTKNKWPDLVEPVRKLLVASRKPFVIENVEGAPLRIDLLLCGSMFGLGMIRHRIFESNCVMPVLMPTCHHEKMYDPWHYGTDQRVQMSRGMGIDWFMDRTEVREAIPPAYTKFIGEQLLKVLR